MQLIKLIITKYTDIVKPERNTTKLVFLQPNHHLFFLEGLDRPHFTFSPLEGILLIEFRENCLWAERLCGVYAYH